MASRTYEFSITLFSLLIINCRDLDGFFAVQTFERVLLYNIIVICRFSDLVFKLYRHLSKVDLRRMKLVGVFVPQENVVGSVLAVKHSWGLTLLNQLLVIYVIPPSYNDSRCVAPNWHQHDTQDWYSFSPPKPPVLW